MDGTPSPPKRWDGANPDALANNILKAFFSYLDNFIDPVNRASDNNPNLYWAQDIECDAGLGEMTLTSRLLELLLHYGLVIMY